LIASASVGDVKVTEIMSRPVITVTPDTSIKAAAELLIGNGISGVPVISPTGRLVGIVSEADLLPLETRPDPRNQATPLRPTAGSSPQRVADVMTRRVVSVPADCEVSRVARILLQSDCPRVPVVSDGEVVGIVSRRDLVRVLARRDDMIMHELAIRLGDLGLGTRVGKVGVDVGVVTIELDDEGRSRQLAESIAVTVQGVFEVRFVDQREH
jgi:CBS domain-containing protein